MRSPLASLAIVVVLVAGCGAATASLTGSSGAPTRAPASFDAARTLPPVKTAAPPATPPPATTGQYKAGETVTVSLDGAPWAEIVVSKVSTKAKYDGPYDTDDIPKKGNVYIQAFVTYKALTDGVDYGPFDWQVFVGDEAVSDSSYVSNGPTPELDSGTLPKGRKASGWVVYEVPKTGVVRMSYGGGSYSNEAPVFEVTIRSK